MHIARLAALTACFVLHARAQPLSFEWVRRLGLGASTSQDSSWLWGWAWAADGSVSVVDRTPVLTYPARPASFGTELAEPLLGYVIPLAAFTEACPADNNTARYPFVPDPVQGCPDLCVSGPHQPERTEAWIALVQRGGCPFVEKARQAQRLGAKAVVVGGDRENPDALLNMYSERDSSDVHIAATFIKYWDYAELLALISTSNTTHQGLKTVSLLLSVEYSAWEWYSPIITFIIILLLPSILTFITLLIHRVRAARAAQRERAPEEFVHRLPWRVWTGTGWEKHAAVYPPSEDPSEDPSSSPDLERGTTSPASQSPRTPPAIGEDEECQPPWVDKQMECAICLEMFTKGDRVRVLPCNHLFHLNEIDEWLISKKKLCPICKADITQPRPHLRHDHSHSPSRSRSPGERESDVAHSAAPETGADGQRTRSPTERTPLLRPNPPS